MRSHVAKRFLPAMLVIAILLSVSGLGLSQTHRRTTRRRRAVRKPVATATVTPAPTHIAVPVGSSLKVRLNDTISSKDARVGDKFTVTVIDPVKYNEATINGHVASLIRSGKIKGRTTMNLAFDRITVTDGRSGVLHGYVSRVYGADAGKADNEGGIESGSRSKQAIKRGGIGAAAGAIIGGLAGGGKGAAIGLILGGAGGAGSLAVQGSKELKLENGTELLIHTTR